MTAIKPLRWISTLYFFQSIPYVIVSVMAILLYQQKGISNTKAALAVSLLVLPWSFKPMIASLVEKQSTPRHLTLWAEFIIGSLFLGIYLTYHLPSFLLWATGGLAIIACLSSIHDVACDGLYIKNLADDFQQKLAPWRGFFFQFGRMCVKGGVLAFATLLALRLEKDTWELFFLCVSLIAFTTWGYHVWILPKHKRLSITATESKKRQKHSTLNLLKNKTFALAAILACIYHFSDAQMQRIVPLYLIDTSGAGFTLSQVGQYCGFYGTDPLQYFRTLG